ncbi:MAG: hypothetical protein HYV97_03675 [Bdellovibrio sp.]|nr:hypothetical protein [Bdellovibrio sp.]
MKKDTESDKAYKKTREELQGLPFEIIREKKKAEDEINMANWKRLSSFKSFRELVNRPEFKDLNDEFKAGFMCGYAENHQSTEKVPDGDDSILKVYKASLGIQVIINEKKPADPVLVAQLAKSLTDSFGLLYYTVSGLIPPGESVPTSEQLKKSVSEN